MARKGRFLGRRRPQHGGRHQGVRREPVHRGGVPDAPGKLLGTLHALYQGEPAVPGDLREILLRPEPHHRRLLDAQQSMAGPANLNFDREVRYYASLGFDGAVWFGQGVTDETKPIYVQCKQGQSAANQIANSWNETGIWPKKLVHFKSVVGQTSGFTKITYPFPVMRLGNLYLLYAEALNESGATKTDVLTWVDLIRERAGLKGVEESWDTYTNNKKYETIDGRREIIQQERGIELAFEAQRFWDLRRWKLAFQEQNKPITGWNTQYSTNEDYYTEQLIYTQEFRIRNYFWPILDKELYSNKNLVQNYGW